MDELLGTNVYEVYQAKFRNNTFSHLNDVVVVRCDLLPQSWIYMLCL